MRFTYRTAGQKRDGVEPPPPRQEVPACVCTYVRRERLPLKLPKIKFFSLPEPPALVEGIDYVSSGIKSVILKTLEFSPAAASTD